MWALVLLILCASVVAIVATSKTTTEILVDWQPKINSVDAFFTEDDTQPLNTEGYPKDLYMV